MCGPIYRNAPQRPRHKLADRGRKFTINSARNQEKRLDDWLKFMNGAGVALSALRDGIDELDQWIAPKIKEILAKMETTYATQKALCEQLKEEGVCSNFKTFISSMVEFKIDFKAQITSLKQQVKGASAARQPTLPQPPSRKKAKVKAT